MARVEWKGEKRAQQPDLEEADLAAAVALARDMGARERIGERMHEDVGPPPASAGAMRIAQDLVEERGDEADAACVGVVRHRRRGTFVCRRAAPVAVVGHEVVTLAARSKLPRLEEVGRAASED